MTNELQQQIIQNYEYFVKLTLQDNADFENVKKIIDDSDSMLNNYRKQFGQTIADKTKEIEQLQEQLKSVKSQNESLRTTLYNIPEDIRKKYIKNTVTSF